MTVDIHFNEKCSISFHIPFHSTYDSMVVARLTLLCEMYCMFHSLFIQMLLHKELSYYVNTQFIYSHHAIKFQYINIFISQMPKNQERQS